MDKQTHLQERRAAHAMTRRFSWHRRLIGFQQEGLIVYSLCWNCSGRRYYEAYAFSTEDSRRYIAHSLLRMRRIGRHAIRSGRVF